MGTLLGREVPGSTSVNLSAGFLLKPHCRNSLPSWDRFSGIGGSLCKTLNIAAGCRTPRETYNKEL